MLFINAAALQAKILELNAVVRRLEEEKQRAAEICRPRPQVRYHRFSDAQNP